MKKLFLWAILSAAALWPQQVTYKFKGKYFDITLTRVGFPTLPLDNGVRKVPRPTDGTQHTAGYVPQLNPAPPPEGYILRAVPRTRPPLCPVTDIRVYLSSGNRPAFLGLYNPVGTPYFVPAAVGVYPRLVTVVCFAVSSTGTDSATEVK